VDAHNVHHFHRRSSFDDAITVNAATFISNTPSSPNHADTPFTIITLTPPSRHADTPHKSMLSEKKCCRYDAYFTNDDVNY